MKGKFDDPEHRLIWEKLSEHDRKLAAIRADLCWLKKITWRLWVPILLSVIGTLMLVVVK